MFAGKHFRKALTHTQREQRVAIQLGIAAMLLLPAIFIGSSL